MLAGAGVGDVWLSRSAVAVVVLLAARLLVVRALPGAWLICYGIG